MAQIANMTETLWKAKKRWCSCDRGKEDRPFAYRWTVAFVKGEEVQKHIVSYYVCPFCKGLIKVEES